MSQQPQLLLLSESPFDTPDPDQALTDPDGLAAVGGDLSPERLVHLYGKGFFPWYSDPDPILWWHPSERCVLKPENFHLSRSTQKSIRRQPWKLSINRCFDTVMKYCAELRADKEGTWITDEMRQAYSELNHLGYAHSIEIWYNGELTGGLYGLAIDHMFFGESMFSLKSNASKIALHSLCSNAEEWNISWIDCQIVSEHLLSLGAEPMERKAFVSTLSNCIRNTEKNAYLQNASGHFLAIPD